MRRPVFLYFLLVMMPVALLGQYTFGELVDRTFGSDQVLVNGVQFSNQYIRVEGNPYWLDGVFHSGSVSVNGQWYEDVWIRYNLYSQRVELEYLTPEGFMNQLMTVPEQIPAFYLQGQEFRRVQVGEEEPAYYQFLTSGTMICFVEWGMEMLGGGSSPHRFGPPKRKYWMQSPGQGEQWITFHNRRSYIRAFPPEQQKEFKKLLKQDNFSFKNATRREMTDMIEASIRLYESGGRP